MSRLKKASNELIQKLKDDLKGEFTAIDLYQKHIDSIDIPEILEKLIEIRDEEKVHAQEIKELLDKYEGGN